MRRAVITGYGVISSIGANKQEVTESLRNGTSGIEFVEEYCEKGFRSHVAGTIKVDLQSLLDRRALRFMGDGAAYNYLAMREAIEHACLEDADISNPRTGLVVGTGGTSTKNLLETVRVFDKRGARKNQAGDGIPHHEQHEFSQPCHLLQNQGSQLHHQFGVRDQLALHRPRGRFGEARRTGHRVRWRRRRDILGVDGHVRLHGSIIQSISTTPPRLLRVPMTSTEMDSSCPAVADWS